MSAYIDEVFGAGGHLARAHDGYEIRPGQVRFARAVEEAIATSTSLLAEGPCGTGKGVGYLVPALHHAVRHQRRVLVATASNALSEQLVTKDLPELERTLPWTFRYAMLKGRGNFACLAAETRVLTRSGTRRISELSGASHELLDGNGNWVRSQVKAFGSAPLMKLTLRRSRAVKVVYATPDHRWLRTMKRDCAQVDEVQTSELQVGDRLRVVRPRAIAMVMRPSQFGVAHGVVFGDGTVFAPTAGGWRTATVVLHGKKKAELLRFFSESHRIPLPLTGRGYAEDAVRVCDLPRRFKELPSISEAPSYLLGWLAGYFATDGTVSKQGVAVLSSSIRENLEFVESICCRLGIATQPIRRCIRTGKGQMPSELFEIGFAAGALPPSFFVRSDQRERYLSVRRERATRTPWVVQAVEATERCEEVYCAVVPTTQSFVLEGYLLTGNCRLAAEEGNSRGLFGAELADYDEVRAWARSTHTGDVGELPRMPSPRVLARFTVQSDECLHGDCPAFERCFYETAKERAFEADVLVTNYHLLFAAMEVARLSGGARVLPAFDIVILDEAHEAADVAREFFGFTLTLRAFARAARLLAEQDWLHGPVLVEAARVLLDATRERCGVGRHRGGFSLGTETVVGLLDDGGRMMAERLRRLDADGDVTGLGEQAEHKRRRRRVDEALRAVGSVRERLEEWEAASDPDRVYLLEATDAGAVSLRAKCVEPGPVLRRHLFGEAKAVIACSATLTVGGTFDFARHELGAPEQARECEVESPFDFARQARLVVPRNMPDPRAPEFSSLVAEALGEVIEACRGRTLGLFTSYKALGEAHASLSQRFAGRYRILRQGELPRAELVRLFREDVGSVLLATQSFWTGIDIPGEALTGLVIDKLPFPPPNDPVAEALAERVPDAFGVFTVPKTAILLKQGVGRLIRTRTDRGVVVLLDNRLLTKGYGRRMLRTLPPMPIGHDLGAIGAFLAREGRAA